MNPLKRSARIRPFLLALILALAVGAGFVREISAGSDETYRGLKLFSDVIEIIEKNYVDPVDTRDLIHKAIQGMVEGLDPHSQFLPPEAFRELQMDTKGEFGGIGIVVTVRRGTLTVVSPIEGTPAYKAGVKAGDVIIKVDGDSTKDMPLWEAVKRMRGPQGSSVVITVVREGVKDPLDFTLERAIIPIESVRYLSLEPGYGYIWITNFRENTLDDTKAALAALESGKTPLRGLILDLRDNPGGLLNAAIDISDLFLDKGVIVSIKGRLERHTKIFEATPGTDSRTYPVIVLINGGSASASEIVAGALQDHKRALLLGTTTFGKGSVQTVEPLRDGYGLKYTIARYYTPSGRSIQAQGIAPDIEVKPRASAEEVPEEDILKERDLKNHLGAEPGEVMEDAPHEDRIAPPQGEDRMGALTVESLLDDEQVKRALELLKGYEILQGLKP